MTLLSYRAVRFVSIHVDLSSSILFVHMVIILCMSSCRNCGKRSSSSWHRLGDHHAMHGVLDNFCCVILQVQVDPIYDCTQ